MFEGSGCQKEVRLWVGTSSIPAGVEENAPAEQDSLSEFENSIVEECDRASRRDLRAG